MVSDPDLLGIVWHNIIGNAVKFAPRQGHVQVRARVQETAVQVQIQDDGGGMDEETQAHMFDKFYQGDTSHASAGNGLGLARVAQIIQLVGGCADPGTECLRPGNDRDGDFTAEAELTFQQHLVNKSKTRLLYS